MDDDLFLEFKEVFKNKKKQKQKIFSNVCKFFFLNIFLEKYFKNVNINN